MNFTSRNTAEPPLVAVKLVQNGGKLSAQVAFGHTSTVSGISYDYEPDDRFVVSGQATSTGDFTGTAFMVPMTITFTYGGKSCRIANDVGVKEVVFTPVCE